MLSIIRWKCGPTGAEMNLSFVKYHGTGNDFVMVDNRTGKYDDLTTDQITKVCTRRFGVGADGLIKINTHPTLDFEIDYYNADGSKSFCGNGARCSVAFAQTLGINTLLTHFMAIDGEHEAIQKDETVSLLMKDVSLVAMVGRDYIINTGSPHYIHFVPGTSGVNVFEEGRAIRYSDPYKEEGINVNFVTGLRQNKIEVLTYERGVEAETFSCGTGVTAAALAYAVQNNLHGEQVVNIVTKGGELQVQFSRTGESEFERIYLIGPAQKVYEGVYSL